MVDDVGVGLPALAEENHAVGADSGGFVDNTGA
jgi:hypothetical protein